MPYNTSALLRGLLMGLALTTACHARTPLDIKPPKLSEFPAGSPATSRQSALNAVAYTEQEWRLQGHAQAYSTDGDWGDDGHWQLKPRGVPEPYETRLLMRRPTSPARFNGIVVVEWLNSSLGFDIDGGWMIARDEMVREGYAWVGVSAETPSIAALQQINPLRYAHAKITDSDLSFDIFDHAGLLIRQEAAQWGTADTQPIRLLAMGYSKSASFLFTFMNAFQPRSQAYDGFYLRGATPAAIQVNGWHINIVAPHIRSDLKAPVMQVQTEMEVAVSWPLSKTPDTDKLRYWEIAGATHYDQAMRNETLAANQDELQLTTPRCLKPANNLPAHLIDHAALHALRNWVTTGAPPPKAPRLQRSSWGFVQDDEQGNALGGLRLPELDAPVSRYGMFNNAPTNSIGMWAGFACIAGGSTTPLSADYLRARYPSDQAYLETYKQAADKLLSKGFLRPIDHAQQLRLISRRQTTAP